MTEKILSGRIAIITGANQGLGREISRSYVTAGANVMLCARNYSTFENVSRNKVAKNLRSARLERLAEGYLAELRSNSTIKYY